MPDRRAGGGKRRATRPAAVTETRRAGGHPAGLAGAAVHPDPDVTAADAARHADEYRLPFPVLLDPTHAVTTQTGVKVVPEAVVLSPAGRVLYRGRIDDRYNASGVRREVVTSHDLEDALTTVLAGKGPAGGRDPGLPQPAGAAA